jgi:WD40 repeat protein
LVCGDETQKPFPLLVWHLSQRKLLYDLRIPHHDFITSLSAITHEGSYVAVVAKELSEPIPNFIVVYDLQSGTLFKKWKPSCNTVSLAISQSNTCVVAGLEDSRILIWDLVTGEYDTVTVKLEKIKIVTVSRELSVFIDWTLCTSNVVKTRSTWKSSAVG